MVLSLFESKMRAEDTFGPSRITFPNPYEQLSYPEHYVYNIDRTQRKMKNEGVVRDIGQILVGDVVNISRLCNVLRAFMKSYPYQKIQIDSNLDVLFEFDEWIWKSEIRTIDTVYKGQIVKFLNVKLPNDGYIYTDNSSFKEKDSEVLQEFREQLKKIMPDGTEFSLWFYNYEFRKLEIHFADNEKKPKWIYHIGFEYGTPEYRNF